MDLKALFKKAGNTLEGGVRIVKKRGSTLSCPRCGSEYDKDSVLKITGPVHAAADIFE